MRQEGARQTRSTPIRRHLRGVAMVVVIVANLIYAVPMPQITEAQRQDPQWQRGTVQALAPWLARAGVAQSVDDLQRRYRHLVWSVKQALLTLRAPAQPVFDALQTNQQWGLFATVTEAPDRLVVEVQRGPRAQWEPLYVRLDPEHDWRDPVFRYRRVRAVWDNVRQQQPKATYKRLAAWTADEVFVEQPDVTAVRFVLERRFLTLPWEPLVTLTQRRAERVHRRPRAEP